MSIDGNMTLLPRTCALYCLYDECYWLPYSYGSIYEHVEKIYFFVSKSPWYGPTRNQSTTFETISALPDPQDKTEIIEGDWSKEIDQRNYSLAIAQVDGFSYGMVVDADEVYDSRQLHSALSHVASHPEVQCWHIRWYTYWKSLLYRIDPPENYNPTVFIKIGTCGFVETRNPLAEKHELVPPHICMCHHLSYAIPEERLRSKHISFSGHSQSAYSEWYEKIWKAWDNHHELENLHPNNPPQFKRAIPQLVETIPEILKPVYLKGGLL